MLGFVCQVRRHCEVEVVELDSFLLQDERVPQRRELTMAVSLTHQIIFYYHSYYHLMTRSVSEQLSREAPPPADALSGELRKKLKRIKKKIKETLKMKEAEIKEAKYNHVENCFSLNAQVH